MPNYQLYQDIIKHSHFNLLVDISVLQQELGISRSRISQAVQEMGLIPISSSDLPILVDLVCSPDMKQKEIAEKYKVTQQFVSYVKVRHLDIIDLLRNYLLRSSLWTMHLP